MTNKILYQIATICEFKVE